MKGGLMEKSIKFLTCIMGLFFLAYSLSALTQNKFEKLKEDNALYSQDVVSIKTRERQLIRKR